jgi:hypothetical protein
MMTKEKKGNKNKNQRKIKKQVKLRLQ